MEQLNKKTINWKVLVVVAWIVGFTVVFVGTQLVMNAVYGQEINGHPEIDTYVSNVQEAICDSVKDNKTLFNECRAIGNNST